MAEIRLELDQESVAIGEALQVQVQVRLDEPDAIRVHLWFSGRITSDGEQCGSELRSEAIDQRSISKTRSHTLYMTVPTPTQPVSYAGESIAVEWTLRCRLSGAEGESAAPVKLTPRSLPAEITGLDAASSSLEQSLARLDLSGLKQELLELDQRAREALDQAKQQRRSAERSAALWINGGRVMVAITIGFVIWWIVDALFESALSLIWSLPMTFALLAIFYGMFVSREKWLKALPTRFRLRDFGFQEPRGPAFAALGETLTFSAKLASTGRPRVSYQLQVSEQRLAGSWQYHSFSIADGKASREDGALRVEVTIPAKEVPTIMADWARVTWTFWLIAEQEGVRREHPFRITVLPLRLDGAD